MQKTFATKTLTKDKTILTTNRRAEVGTLLSRIVTLFSTLGIVLLNTNYLGTEGQGTASLVNLGILLIVALSNFIGGGALSYLIPRMGAKPTLWPSLIWALVSTIILYIVFQLYNIVPEEYIFLTCALGLIQSLFIYFLQVIVARMSFAHYNLIVGVQSLSAFLSLLLLYAVFGFTNTNSFLVSLFISFGITLIFSVYAAIPIYKHYKNKDVSSSAAFIELLSYGKFVQGGNIFHLLNQRLNFVLLENLAPSGRLLTGIFSLAMYAAEAIWTVAKSLSLVQASTISNSEDEQAHHRLTSSNMKISVGIAFIASMVILAIPEKLYATIFGSEVEGLKLALITLIPAIIANSFSIIYAHYFSGTGRHRYNMYASALGFAGGILSGIILIPEHHLQGAAWSASIAFVLQAVVLSGLYRKKWLQFKSS